MIGKRRGQERMKNELPTIKDCTFNNEWDKMNVLRLLSIHEAHAEEMLDDHHGSGCACERRNDRDCDIESYWCGRLEALRALKGEVKK